MLFMLRSLRFALQVIQWFNYKIRPSGVDFYGLLHIAKLLCSITQFYSGGVGYLYRSFLSVLFFINF